MHVVTWVRGIKMRAKVQNADAQSWSAIIYIYT